MKLVKTLITAFTLMFAVPLYAEPQATNSVVEKPDLKVAKKIKTTDLHGLWGNAVIMMALFY